MRVVWRESGRPIIHHQLRVAGRPKGLVEWDWHLRPVRPDGFIRQYFLYRQKQWIALHIAPTTPSPSLWPFASHCAQLSYTSNIRYSARDYEARGSTAGRERN